MYIALLPFNSSLTAGCVGVRCEVRLACVQIRTEDAQHIFARIERSCTRARVPVDMLILVGYFRIDEREVRH